MCCFILKHIPPYFQYLLSMSVTGCDDEMVENLLFSAFIRDINLKSHNLPYYICIRLIEMYIKVRKKLEIDKFLIVVFL